MLYGDCPNLPGLRTFIVFATCSGVVDTAGQILAAHGYIRRRWISVGKPPQLSGLMLPVTLDGTRQMLERRPRSIGWDGAVVSSRTHWPSSCQSGVQHHQRRHWSMVFLLLSPSISRYCYLWIGQPQLLSNTTSGFGFHATASRLSQLVWSRSLSSDAHSRTVQSSLQLRSHDQTTTWRGIGGAVVHDALATTVPTSSSTISSNSRTRVTGPLVSALASGQSATPEWRPQGLNTAGV